MCGFKARGSTGRNGTNLDEPSNLWYSPPLGSAPFCEVPWEGGRRSQGSGMKFKGEGAVRLKLPWFSEPPADSSISVTGDVARGAGTAWSSRVFLAGLLGLLGLRKPRPSANTRTPSPL
jgi:hypothetical protein